MPRGLRTYVRRPLLFTYRYKCHDLIDHISIIELIGAVVFMIPGYCISRPCSRTVCRTAACPHIDKFTAIELCSKVNCTRATDVNKKWLCGECERIGIGLS